MNKNSIVLSAERIKAFLPEAEKNTEIRIFKSIDSTNSEAKRAISSGLYRDAVFVAEEQTAGRGRRGKSFYSPNSSGLYFTAVLHPDTSLSDSTGITAAAAVAVTEIIAKATKKDPKIKWVNDIFIDGRKVCGILVEAVTEPNSSNLKAAVIGIGINLTTDIFPDELSEIAGSLNTDTDRCRLTAELYIRLKELCSELTERSFMEDYRKYSLILGKNISFTRNGTDYTAKAVNILDDGSLEVLTMLGERMILNSGEISIRPEQP